MSEQQNPLLGEDSVPTLTSRKPSNHSLMSLVTLLGAALFIVPVWKVVLDQDWMLFSYHPILMSTTLVLLAIGITTLQPLPRNATEKSKGLTRHQLYQIPAILLAVIGASIMYANKANHGAEHYTTYHGKMGLATLLFVLGVASAGSATVYAPFLFGGEAKAKSFWKVHRLGGYATLALVLITASLGTHSDWFVINGKHHYDNVLLAGAVMIAIGVASRIHLSKMRFF